MKEGLCYFKEMSELFLGLMEYKWGEIDVVKALKEVYCNYSGKNRAFFNLIANQYLEQHLDELELAALKLEFGTETLPYKGEVISELIFNQSTETVECAYKSAMKKLTVFRDSSEYKLFVRASRKGITKEYIDNNGLKILTEKWNRGHYSFDPDSSVYWACQRIGDAVQSKLLHSETVSEKDVIELFNLMDYRQKTIAVYLLTSEVQGNISSINDLPRIIDSIVPDFRIIRTQEYHSGAKTRHLAKPKSVH